MTPALVVVDASVVISWLLPDEDFSRHNHVYTKLFNYKLYAPHIIEYEVLNFIVVSMKRKKFSALQREDAVNIIQDIPVVKDFVLDSLHEKLAVFKLAEEFGLTAYDAAYLELASRLRVPLLTYDEALLRAAKALEIKMNI